MANKNPLDNKLHGYYSEILETKKHILKRISCIPGGMLWTEAQNLREHIAHYKEELDLSKIPNPKLISCKFDETGKNRHILVIKEEKIVGDNITNLVKNRQISNERFVKYCEKILKYFLRVSERGRRISLDPPLTNFVFGKNSAGVSDIYYVDSMPPRQKTFNKWVVEYPGPQNLELQNYHYKRHFSDSQLQTIFVQMCKVNLSCKDQLTEIFEQVFSKDAINYISVPRSIHNIFNLLNSSEINDVDYFRNISLQLLRLGVISRVEFDHIYRQTHIQEGTGDTPNISEFEALNLFLRNSMLNFLNGK